MSRQPLRRVAEPDLFAGNDPPQPHGLRYEPACVTPDEERTLIKAFGTLPLAPFQFGAFEGKRWVASFGVRYDYADQRVHEAATAPSFMAPFIARAERFAGMEPGAIRHVYFSAYDVGAGIGWHRDKAAFDQVLGLSLGSTCPFRFRRKQENGWQRYTLEAAPRSIYLLSGEARAVWEHSIAPVIEPRWSITFRTMAAR
jgi:alkylated DNA repair dioxygenase AlkB